MRAVVVIALSTACGGSGGAPLTCELLADPTNCWAEAAAAFAACIPMRASAGALSADRTTCTYPDGVRVVFDTALPTDPFDLDRFALTVFTGDTKCARFVDTFSNRMELTAEATFGGETVVSELHGGGDFHLHCPGADFETDFDTLFTCSPPAYAPTDGFSVDATSVSFTISSTSTVGELLHCAR